MCKALVRQAFSLQSLSMKTGQSSSPLHKTDSHAGCPPCPGNVINPLLCIIAESAQTVLLGCPENSMVSSHCEETLLPGLDERKKEMSCMLAKMHKPGELHMA